MTSKTLDTIQIWEKRLAWLIVTLIMGYIATIAGDVHKQIGIIDTKLNNVTALVKNNQCKLDDHDIDLRRQDNRLSIVETRIESGK